MYACGGNLLFRLHQSTGDQILEFNECFDIIGAVMIHIKPLIFNLLYIIN